MYLHELLQADLYLYFCLLCRHHSARNVGALIRTKWQIQAVNFYTC
jgi:hypothetical protein